MKYYFFEIRQTRAGDEYLSSHIKALEDNADIMEHLTGIVGAWYMSEANTGLEVEGGCITTRYEIGWEEIEVQSDPPVEISKEHYDVLKNYLSDF